MSDLLVQILTNNEARDETTVQDAALQQVEVATPWFD
jgi:hypothetical protein